MREIKFRAWAKGEFDESIMLDWETFRHSIAEWIGNEERGCVLMQYTGLEDKNGKEIYEGDIVRLNEVIKSENTKQKLLQNADYVQVDDVCVVEWDKEGADFQMTSSNHCRGFGSREDQDIEVIGNIYENKDLVH